MSGELYELIVKSPSEPGEYGYRPKERPILLYIENGIIILDKPRGPTSHEVTKLIGKILEFPGKVGHCGTLDPKVTGVLPIVLGNATKLSRIIAGTDKEYVGVLYLHGEVSDQELVEALNKFEGPIYQRPPLKSAIKRTLRVRRVFKIELIERKDRYVLLRTVVESGTYIRKLFHDIGEYLGVGASMRELRRTRSGFFHEKESHRVEEVLDAYVKWREEGDESALRKVIQPLEEAVRGLPRIVVKDSAVASVTYGASLKVKGVSMLSPNIKAGSLVAIMTLKGELVALGRAKMTSSEIERAESGVVAEIERVIMPRDLYPPMWKRKE